VDARCFAATKARLPADLTFTNDGHDEGFVIDTLLDGGVGIDRGKTVSRFTSGDTFLGTGPRWHCTVRSCDVCIQAITLPRPLLTAVAATALAVFPNTAISVEHAGSDRRDARPHAVVQAVNFIEEHAHRDISLADIAAAASVTTRSIQLAFQRHLETTPMAYLRRVRLDHAHRQLQAADPARDTVTAVARQWGFSSASRFAAHYRAAYGVPPSHALQR
jgi:AraC-like DNA-binding protein